MSIAIFMNPVVADSTDNPGESAKVPREYVDEIVDSLELHIKNVFV